MSAKVELKFDAIYREFFEDLIKREKGPTDHKLSVEQLSKIKSLTKEVPNVSAFCVCHGAGNGDPDICHLKEHSMLAISEINRCGESIEDGGGPQCLDSLIGMISSEPSVKEI